MGMYSSEHDGLEFEYWYSPHNKSIHSFAFRPDGSAARMSDPLSDGKTGRKPHLHPHSPCAPVTKEAMRAQGLITLSERDRQRYILKQQEKLEKALAAKF